MSFYIQYTFLHAIQYGTVYVFATMWGRMDQQLGNLCTMFRFNNMKVYLVSEDSVSFVLKEV